jgi:hypothetical protein
MREPGFDFNETILQLRIALPRLSFTCMFVKAGKTMTVIFKKHP